MTLTITAAGKATTPMLRSFKTEAGDAVAADDLDPNLRRFALLLEHHHARRDAGLEGPCLCPECKESRVLIEVRADGAFRFRPPEEV